MIEHSIAFGEDRGLIGTICKPSEPVSGPPGLGMILFNAGVIHRVGPHRLNVRLARKLAEQGIPSIRFDLAGLGDSARPTGNRSFEAQAVVDLRSAMDALTSAARSQRFALLGLCSGAAHGYATSFADDRVVGLLMYDNYRYRTLKAWWNLFAMRVKEHGLPRAVGGFVLGKISTAFRRAGDRLNDVGFISTGPSKAEFADGLKTLLNRGVEIGLIYTGEGFELYNYERQFHDAFHELGVTDRVRVNFLPDLDHAATSIAAQADLVLRIQRFAVELNAPTSPSRFADQE